MSHTPSRHVPVTVTSTRAFWNCANANEYSPDERPCLPRTLRKLEQGMCHGDKSCQLQRTYTRVLTIRCASSFAEIYDTLPPDAQRRLLDSYLLPLLDDLPVSITTKVINSAKEMQTRFMAIPKLDYFAKRTELEGLLNEIERDQKQSLYIKERSTREKLIEETIDSLSTWVNDIWSVIFEYQTNFRMAHQCLLLQAEILRRMFAPYGGCVLLHFHFFLHRWRCMLDVTVPL